MKNKKTIIGILIFLFTILFNLDTLKAGCTISVSAPSSVKTGSNFNVSVTVPSNSGSWEYTLSYDSSKVKLVSGNLKVVGVYGDSRTSSYTFKSIAEGSASFKAVNASIYDYNSVEECYSGSGTANVNMSSVANNIKGSVANADKTEKSNDNNLKNLSVDSYELSPKFSKDILEYNINVASSVEKIKVDAEKNDTKAKISGIGEIEVKEGLNKIEVVVTAENGDTKTYTINVTVEEKNPINVKVNGKKYVVVRKEEDIKNIPANFKKTTIKIGSEDVPAYVNKKINITLVALKDEKDNVKLFIYEKRNYKELYYMSNGVTNLILLDAPKNLLYVYNKVNFKYNSINYKGYKYIPYSNKDEYLIYGVNLDTNKKNFYIYDSNINGFIKYSKKDLLKDNLLTVLGLLLGLIIFIWIIKVLRKIFTSKRKKVERLNKKIEKLKKEDDFEEDDDEEPVITKLEDTKPLPKKSRKAKREELINAKKLLDKDKPKSVRRVSLEPDDMDDYDF